MHIWLVQPHEHTPLDSSARVLRHGQLARHLAMRGIEVTWWTSRFYHHKKMLRAGPERLRTEDGYNLVQLPGPGYAKNISLRRIRHYRALARAFEERAREMQPRPDLIHCALPPIELVAAGVGLARELSVVSTVDILDTWPDVYLTAVPRPLRPLMRPALTSHFRRAEKALSDTTAIIGISECYLSWGLAKASREKRAGDAVFPLGYRPFEPSSDQATEGLPLPPERLAGKTVATFVGSFVSMCDVEVLLDVARSLQERSLDDVVFVIAGDGPLGGRFRRKAADLDNVIFTGWLSQGQVTRLLQRSDLGIAPYVPGATQSLPNKLFEYLAAGLPVITSLEGEAKKLLTTEEIGTTYRAGSPRSLLEELLRLGSDGDLRSRYAERAARVFEERFSADRIYENMADYLIRLAQTDLR